MSIRRLLIALLLPAALLLHTPAALAAKDPVFTSTFSDLAIRGYDPVAYFTEARPVEGQGSFEYEWNGATWRFAKRENLESFKANPQAYAPRYGGYCAWAVSQGSTASTVPEAWRIVNGKLYLNYSKGVQARWERDIPGNIAKANQNWPKVLN